MSADPCAARGANRDLPGGFGRCSLGEGHQGIHLFDWPEAQVRDLNDPREQRGLALRRLAQAHYELDCALGYLQNSDSGSIVVDDARGLVDKLEALQRMLEWRQRKDDTP